ncbi:MAG: hypothetical protein ACI4SG_02820 [Oligosphaeraceae bacterium]
MPRSLPLLLVALLALLCPGRGGRLQAGASPNYVTYERFGAKGDGKENDLPAIRAAHQYANEHNLPVRGKNGAVYRIEAGEPAIIKTDTDFQDAKFVIDDSRLTVKEGQVDVFRVESDTPPWDVQVPAPLRQGATQLGAALPQRALVVLSNKNKKHFIRLGLNQNDGVPASDTILVEKDGSIHPSTPLLWDFPEITSAKAYSVEDRPIVIRGGIFTTIANRAEPKYTYYSRGFLVQRSNVILENHLHAVTGEGPQGAPYAGFFRFQTCYNSILRNCRVSGHKTYSTIGSAGKPVTMGTYDLGANRAVRLVFQNVKQMNDIHDTTRWGIMGTNFCRDLILEGCTLSRFDAHQGVANVIIRNCVLGHAGVNLIGYGNVLMENTWVHSPWLMNLRGDYGSTWRGNLTVRNCVLAPPKYSGQGGILNGYNTGTHDFGYPCVMPDTITLQNLTILDRLPKGNLPIYFFADFLQKRDKPGRVPYLPTRQVLVQRVATESGSPIQISPNPVLFSQTRILPLAPR